MKRILFALSVLVPVTLSFATVRAAAASPDALLSDADRRHQEQAVQNALEFNRTGVAEFWENPSTGHHGRVTPTLTYRNSAGQDCRKFYRELTVDGREAEARSTRCRTTAGAWLQPPAPRPVHTRGYDDRRRYYPYYGSYWYYPPVSVHLFYEFHRHRHKMGRHRGHHRHRLHHRHRPHHHHRSDRRDRPHRRHRR